MKSTRRSTAALTHILASLAGLATASTLLAQAAPATTSPAMLAKYDANRNGVLDSSEVTAMQAGEPSAESKDAILMTPFSVSTEKDRGYFGGSTLAGGRADTPLKITPASISVMTKEFLEDFDLTDMNQAAAWTVGMDAAEGGESGAFGGNRFQASFRGAGTGGNFPVRDGSINYFVSDSYNTERLDFSRGPNAALFGDGGPGGLQGSTSKKARLNNHATSTTFRVDSFGGYRVTVDTNYGVDRLAVRLNLLRQEIKAYQDGTNNTQNGFTTDLTYKIAENTQFSAQVQRDSESNIAYRRTYGEQASRWDGTTVNTNNTAISNFANFGLGLVAGNTTDDRLIWNFGTNSLLNYKGNQYQTIGLGYQIPWEGRPDLPNFKSGVDKKFFLGPADARFDRDFNRQAYTLDHRFSPDFYVQLGIVKNDGDPYYNYTDQLPGDYRIDVNRLLPNGQTNPNFGEAYSDFGQSFQYQQDKVREYKFAGTYRFAAPRIFDLVQRFSLNTGWRRTTFEALNQSWRWSNNPANADVNSQVNQLRYRIYWNQPRPSIQPQTPPAIPGVDWRLVQTGGNINQRTIVYAQILSQSTFFNERLALTAGIRRDRVEGDFFNRVGQDPVTYKNIGGFNIDGVNVVGAHKVRKIWMSSPSVGLVAYPFKDTKSRLFAPLGFVANYSSNFTQIGASSVPLLNGEDPPLTRSTTKDFGLRYAVGDGIAYVTLSHYNTTQEDVLSGWGNRGDFQSLYLNLGYTDPLYVGSTGFNYQDSASNKLEGWEAEVTANPTRNITLTANYSHPIVTQIIASRDRRAFYAANLAEYQAGAAATSGQVVNGKTIIDPNLISQAMTNIENSFNGSTAGTLQNNLERHRINLAGSYRFNDGKLKGLGLNAGVNYRGYKKVGSRDARLKFQTVNPTTEQTVSAAYDYLWVDPTWSMVAGANYTRRFGKIQARFQVNITNLLDDDDPQWRSYSVINAGTFQNLPNSVTSNGNALTVTGGNPRMQVLSGFNQLEPRKISFTTTLSF